MTLSASTESGDHTLCFWSGATAGDDPGFFVEHTSPIYHHLLAQCHEKTNAPVRHFLRQQVANITAIVQAFEKSSSFTETQSVVRHEPAAFRQNYAQLHAANAYAEHSISVHTADDSLKRLEGGLKSCKVLQRQDEGQRERKDNARK